VDGITTEPAAGDGGGSSPLLDLAGFSGRLERLLALARALVARTRPVTSGIGPV